MHETALQINHSTSILYRSELDRQCPFTNNQQANLETKLEKRVLSSLFVACSMKENILNFSQIQLEKSEFPINSSYENIQTLQICLNICVARFKYVAFSSYSKTCICLPSIQTDLNQMTKNECIAFNDTNIFEIYKSGFLGFKILIILSFLKNFHSVIWNFKKGSNQLISNISQEHFHMF